MATLTPADVKSWDPDAIHGVFQTATNRAATLRTPGDNLHQVHNNLSDWHGEAGDAFRADLGKARRDIDADDHETKLVAAAVSHAEADVRAVKAELDGIQQAAERDGFSITSDWRIDSGGMNVDSSKSAAKQQLQTQLDTCKQHAHNADQELATAIRSAVGEARPAPERLRPRVRASQSRGKTCCYRLVRRVRSPAAIQRKARRFPPAPATCCLGPVTRRVKSRHPAIRWIY